MWPAERKLEALSYRSTRDIIKQSSVYLCWVLTVYHIIHFATETEHEFGGWLMQNNTISEFMNTVERDEILIPGKDLRNRCLKEINLPDELLKRYIQIVHPKWRQSTNLMEQGGKENELMFACLDVANTHYIYTDVSYFSIEKNKNLDSNSPEIHLLCLLSKHEEMGPNDGVFNMKTHRDEFNTYIKEYATELVVGGFMVETHQSNHSLAICRIDGDLRVVDSWDSTDYNLYDLPETFVITSLTFIYSAIKQTALDNGIHTKKRGTR